MEEIEILIERIAHGILPDKSEILWIYDKARVIFKCESNVFDLKAL